MPTKLFINASVKLKTAAAFHADIEGLNESVIRTAEEFYRRLNGQYPKFFKMDVLCKWAWLGAEMLMRSTAEHLADKENFALALHTHNGCLDVDKKYWDTVKTIPSPALFVYTLPNIMLGELAIRHGFKGQQTCVVLDHFDAEELYYNFSGLAANGPLSGGIAGWVNATEHESELCFFLISHRPSEMTFDIKNLTHIFQQDYALKIYE